MMASELAKELNPIIEFIGEENAEKLRLQLTDMLLENIQESIEEYWLVYPEEWQKMLDSLLRNCGKEICKKYKDPIKESMEDAILKIIERIKNND